MNFESMMIGLAPDLSLGEGSDSPIDGADLKVVVGERWSDPQDYQHMPFEEKLRLADVMIARWQRYREAVIEDNTIPH